MDSVAYKVLIQLCKSICCQKIRNSEYWKKLYKPGPWIKCLAKTRVQVMFNRGNFFDKYSISDLCFSRKLTLKIFTRFLRKTPSRKTLFELYWWLRYGWCSGKFVNSFRTAINSGQTEAHSEPSQTPKMELFAKIVNGFKLLTTFVKKIRHSCFSRFWLHLC